MLETSPTTIPGPEGPLEAILSSPDQALERIAVLCHPHPRYGGSLHDQVLDVLARCLAKRGIASLRFNFRGVGQSAGTYSGAGGEVDDLRAVLDWVRAEHPDATLYLGGYSFGASIVSQVLTDALPQRVLLVAPPLGNMTVERPPAGVCVDVIVGSADAFVDPAALADFGEARIHRIDGADHFFAGYAADLAAAIDAALEDDPTGP